MSIKFTQRASLFTKDTMPHWQLICNAPASALTHSAHTHRPQCSCPCVSLSPSTGGLPSLPPLRAPPSDKVASEPKLKFKSRGASRLLLGRRCMAGPLCAGNTAATRDELRRVRCLSCGLTCCTAALSVPPPASSSSGWLWWCASSKGVRSGVTLSASSGSCVSWLARCSCV